MKFSEAEKQRILEVCGLADVHHRPELQKRLDAVKLPSWFFTKCAHDHITREDYLNPCSSAACKQSGQHTYHLGCGSQYKEWCDDCGELIVDSAQDEIDNVKWDEIEYRCNACESEIQEGHFACGVTYSVPA